MGGHEFRGYLPPLGELNPLRAAMIVFLMMKEADNG